MVWLGKLQVGLLVIKGFNGIIGWGITSVAALASLYCAATKTRSRQAAASSQSGHHRPPPSSSPTNHQKLLLLLPCIYYYYGG